MISRIPVCLFIVFDIQRYCIFGPFHRHSAKAHTQRQGGTDMCTKLSTSSYLLRLAKSKETSFLQTSLRNGKIARRALYQRGTPCTSSASKCLLHLAECGAASSFRLSSQCPKTHWISPMLFLLEDHPASLDHLQ